MTPLLVLLALHSNTSFELDALSELNRARRELHLGELTADESMARLAAEQCNYLVVNKQLSSHTQEEGHPGFTGKTLADRVKRIQTTMGVSELIHGGKFSGGDEMIRGLLAVPYHRFPLVHPGAKVFGAETGLFDEDRVAVVYIGRVAASGVVVMPRPEQEGVPTTAHTYEVPDPLRMHRQRKALRDKNGNLLLEEENVGSYITMNVYPTTEVLTLAQASLTTEQQEVVPIWVNTPANDDFLKASVFLTPKAPLAPNTKYFVTLSFSGESAKYSKNWWFKTGEK